MAITDYSATAADNSTVPGTPAIQLGYAVHGVPAHQIQTEAIQRIMADLKAHHTAMGGLDGLAKTDGNFIVGDGANWIAESGATARTSLGAAGLADSNVFSASQNRFSAAGTAAAPSIATETDAGLYRSAAGEVSLAATGEQKMRWRGGTAATWSYLDVDTDGSRFEIQKHSSPASYSGTAAGLVVQTEETQDRSASSIYGTGAIIACTVSGDGSTTGNTSATNWTATRSSMTKSGDASAACFGGTGTLNDVTTHNSGTAQAGSSTTITLQSGASTTNDEYNGKIVTITGGTGSGQSETITDYDGGTLVATVASFSTAPDATSTYTITGYNELGGISLALTNNASTNGVVTGAEILIRDSSDAGVTDFDTQLHVFTPRIARYNNGSQSCAFIFCSAEGSVAPDAIIKCNSNGLATVSTGLNFRDFTFSSGQVAQFPNDTAIAWENTSGTLVEAINVNGTNQLVLKSLGASAAVVIQDGGSESRLKCDNGGVEIRPSGESALAEITVGANDSGGSGFKVLRIPN